ncbi:hypothetical protein GOA59_20755 [Sinorhizobium meliloti]|uniref:nuclear transport factor 2 family protein n=1 Tax=Rhizobium meliloti TaxID=382 RepID=UPI0012965D12|nr:nuclear transport factor 2 family protein [Sinorhizobium meliloti]MDW9486217.1 hypothetical protein [Sinorhizobium meliloti]MDW9502283.1 hypothetical protein [Sinorhizobium meliloti]MDW9605108.1 hypothetical protein [Sinorhizobium meliloti]MDW9629150.1 hypothetical protein [Sinorhizobium meliloti]MDW9675207.1 hypothetical protein [Sinorhizobium meliloti]
MTHQTQKKQAVQDYLNAVGKGDAETIASLVAEDYIHEFLGSTVFATGKRTLTENRELLKTFRSSLVADGKFTIHDIAEEGDLVLAVFTGECELVNGKRYDGVYAASFHFRGDKIISMRELMDTKLADAVMA